MVNLREGERISNYILEARLGVGSFGEVWRARHHVFGDLVAIKVPTDRGYVRNLQHEGVAVHGIRHPNIVRAIDLDPYGDPPYLVMEFVDGPSLREVIDKYGPGIPVPAVTAIMEGLLTALAVAHESGLVHRDVKPANILLAHGLDDMAHVKPAAVKVTDFGLGKVGGDTASMLLQSGSLHTDDGRDIAGTVAYMSPEQREGREVTGASDLYACGVVFFELLTGERPQGHDLPSGLRSGLPGHFDEVFRRSYGRLERRYATADEMLSDLLPRANPLRPSTPIVPPPVPVARSAAPSAAQSAVSGATGRRCPKCSFTADKADQFCIKCGEQLVASVPRCPNPECRAFVQTRDKFCVFCGTSLQVLTD